MEQIRKTVLETGNKFWGGQLEAQRLAVAAWVALDEGKKEDAVKEMRSAADLEDSLGKSPVTPGAIMPVRELLADMLVEMKQPGLAVVEYEAVLRTSPNRLNALYGVGYAAELAGQKAKAGAYYSSLLKLCASADGSRPVLEHAQRFLSQEKAASQ